MSCILYNILIPLFYVCLLFCCSLFCSIFFDLFSVTFSSLSGPSLKTKNWSWCSPFRLHRGGFSWHRIAGPSKGSQDIWERKQRKHIKTIKALKTWRIKNSKDLSVYPSLHLSLCLQATRKVHTEVHCSQIFGQVFVQVLDQTDGRERERERERTNLKLVLWTETSSLYLCACLSLSICGRRKKKFPPQKFFNQNQGVILSDWHHLLTQQSPMFAFGRLWEKKWCGKPFNFQPSRGAFSSSYGVSLSLSMSLFVHPTRRIVYSGSFSGNFRGSFWRCARLF